MLISPFTQNDLKFLPELQPPDWTDIMPSFHYYLNNGSFCYPVKVSIEKELVGIGTAIIHKDVAWLAHIVVHEKFRNSGIGTFITNSLVELLTTKKCKTIMLVATPLGEPVYKKIGFEVEGEYTFLKSGFTTTPHEISKYVLPATSEYTNEIFELDRVASGEDRSIRLNEFLGNGYVFQREGKVRGFYLPSFGEGLVIASDNEAGLALLTLRNQSNSMAVIPTANKNAIHFITSCGYNPYRSAKRMRMGISRSWKPEMIYNRVSGQVG